MSSSPELMDINPNQWIADLTTADREILKSNAWVNEAIIYASMEILGKQCEEKIHGWQCSQLAQNLSFRPIPPSSRFVQIFHVGGNHWVTVSNVQNSEVNAISVYDSLPRRTMSTSFKEQICSLVQPRYAKVVFDIVRVELQPNAYDCGVYAIANATELAQGRDPVLCVWKTNDMRKHLISCLESGQFSQFPLVKKRRGTLGGRVRTSIPVSIQCIVCRMPNNKSKPMIRCSNCCCSYHLECVHLSSSKESTSAQDQWICGDCIRILELA